jgi:hypothetical protein
MTCWVAGLSLTGQHGLLKQLTTTVHVWLGCGDAAKALRRPVLQQRVGQGVQQEVAGSEVGCGGPDALAWDEFEGGPCG